MGACRNDSRFGHLSMSNTPGCLAALSWLALGGLRLHAVGHAGLATAGGMCPLCVALPSGFSGLRW